MSTKKSFVVNNSTVNFNDDKFSIVGPDGTEYGEWYSEDYPWTEPNLAILKKILENENWTEDMVSTFVEEWNEKN